MSNSNQKATPAYYPTLPSSGVRAFLFQGFIVTTAVGLPALAHISGMPVRILLPMHWPVILAGLVYGWRGGAVCGLLSPSASMLVSGLPLAIMVPAVTIELFFYGFGTGILRERFRCNPCLSIGIALLLGRAAFMMAVVLTGAVTANYLLYFKAALLPGLGVAALQILLLPIVGNWWIKQDQPNPRREPGA